MAGIQAAVALGGRVAEVERRHRDVRRALRRELLDHRAIADPAVDADQHVNAAGKRLVEDGTQCLREGLPDGRHHDDASVERGLQVAGHEGSGAGGEGRLWGAGAVERFGSGAGQM